MSNHVQGYKVPRPWAYQYRSVDLDSQVNGLCVVAGRETDLDAKTKQPYLLTQLTRPTSILYSSYTSIVNFDLSSTP